MSKQPTKVMLLISNLEYGGAQRQVVELANNLDADAFEVHVCSLSKYIPLVDKLTIPQENFHVVNKNYKFDVLVTVRLASLCKNLGIEVLHSYLFDADVAARIAGKIAGLKLVIGSERNTNYVLKKMQMTAFKLTRNWVDMIIPNSHAGAEFNRALLGYPPSFYRVIYNGVDTQKFFPETPGNIARIRESLGIKPDELIVGKFASFKRQKNHPMFFSAMAKVLDRFPNARLMLVGDILHAGKHGSNKYAAEIDRLVDELGIRDRCIFLGNRNDVPRVYNACDITVLSSHYEGTPNVLLESMACGVPVVATNVSDNAKVVKEGETGFVVDLGDIDALADRVNVLFENNSPRTKMGTAAHEYMCGEFSTQRLAEKTQLAYEEALRMKVGA